MASLILYAVLEVALLASRGAGAGATQLAQGNTGALSSTSSLGGAPLSTPGSWYCDGDRFCDGGGACCPDLLEGGFTCVSNDAWANCLLFDARHCPGDRPVICGGSCCSPDSTCRDGKCRPRASSGTLLGLRAASPGPLAFTRAVGPSRLGWWPGSWDGGMLRTVQEGLHNVFLAVQASEWRSGVYAAKAGQCFVVGFPADLANCNQPFDDGCQGSSATIVQDGSMTFYNNQPILTPTNYDGVDWCNDDPHESQIHEHSYTYTETQSFETTVSSTVKTTVGMESKTKMSESLIFESGSEEIDLSFSLEVDVTATRSQTTTREKQWSEKNTVNVGPRSHVYSTCWLSMGSLESPFDARVKIHSPVVWACTEPDKGYSSYISPSNQALWQSFQLESYMQQRFGFTEEDLQAIFSAKFGGTWKGIVGQKVQCNTHTVLLTPGETCAQRSASRNLTMIV